MMIKLIINPEAGIQQRKLDRLRRKILTQKKEAAAQIKDFFEKKGFRISVSKTKKTGDTTRIARQSNNYDIIIAAGGDGTINEVINGLGNYNGRIGIIPLGSTNVTAKELGIPFNTEEACEVIANGKTRKIDVGMMNDKKFIFVAGIGFDAHAITNVEPRLKELIGRHSYTIAGIKTLFEHKPEELKIKIGKKEEKGYFALVSNVKRYGGNIKIIPDAEMDDGYLDLCIFKKSDVWSVMKYVVGAASGTITNTGGISYYKIKKAEISSKKKVLYHTDAEIGGTTPVSVKVLPKHLEIFTP